jgi:hypothetical protein
MRPIANRKEGKTMTRAGATALGLAFAAVVAAVAVGTASARTTTLISFRTPSANIYCLYNSADSGSPAFLRCDIRSHLHPAPPAHSCVEGVYGQSVGMTKTGAARVLCISDTTYNPQARVLAYGTSWARDGFRCTSRSAGLTCTNQRGHGFFLSRQSWYVR